MKWSILAFGIVANASASMLIKLAILPPRTFPSISAPLNALTNWPFWAGLGLYGVALLLYAAALTRLPLNVAHPILTAGAIALVALCSSVMFQEPMSWTTLMGIILIISGVILITANIA